MRSIPALLLADMKKDETSIALLWTIELADGRVVRGTEHDLDVEIPATGDSPPDPFAGVYRAIANVTMGDIDSTSDLSVDNTEVTGAFQDDQVGSPVMATVLDVNAADIEAGLFDNAPVTVILVNWKEPSHGYFVMKGGTLGNISYDSDGKYTTEVRGLTQLLQQTIIRTFSVTCNVVTFGDKRCGFNVPANTVTGEVVSDSTGDLHQFTVSLSLPGSPVFPLRFDGGDLTFTTGDNAGFTREAKTDPTTNDGVVQFWDQFPNEVRAGDEFTFSPGCNRQPDTCKAYGRFIAGWRGYGLFIPGVNAITAGPTTTAELG